MASQWFYKVMGEQLGPISGADLQSLAQHRVVLPDTPVAKNPDGPWVPAERVRGLLAESSKMRPPAPIAKAGTEPTDSSAPNNRGNPRSSFAKSRVSPSRLPSPWPVRSLFSF